MDAWAAKLEKTTRAAKNAIIALAVFSLVISAAAVIVGGLGYAEAYRYSGYLSIVTSRAFPTGPFVLYIDQAAIPVVLTLPNNLQDYVGHTYRVWSRTAQAHVVSIAGTGSTFDGTATTATFGGAIGDGFVFEVIDRNRAVIVSATNVVFS